MEPGTVFTVNKDDILLGLLACFLPPIAVAVRQGFWRKDTLICFLLTAIFGFPGMFHAFYVIYTTSAERRLYDSLSGGPDLEAQNSGADDASSHKSAPSGELPPNYDEISHDVPPSGPVDQKISQ